MCNYGSEEGTLSDVGTDRHALEDEERGKDHLSKLNNLAEEPRSEGAGPCLARARCQSRRRLPTNFAPTCACRGLGHRDLEQRAKETRSWKLYKLAFWLPLGIINTGEGIIL